MPQNSAKIEMMEENLGPAELVEARRRREQFDRNHVWLKTQIPEIYRKYRGKCLCIAGQELFAADTVEEAVARARAAHPEDEGWFTRYIPKERAVRVYAV
jgi:hypothetical protein